MISTAARLALAMVCGGLLGFDRERKGRPAGFRTHILVCVGSALAMVTNQYMAMVYPGVDPARMGAQVISGIGFLGAGTIMVTGVQKIKGLTTAAGLWVVACIGLAIGTGFYLGGVITTLLCILANTILHTWEEKLSVSNKLLNMYVELTDMTGVGRLIKRAKENDLDITDMSIGKAKFGEEHAAVIIYLKSTKKMDHNDIIKCLQETEGVVYVEEV